MKNFVIGVIGPTASQKTLCGQILVQSGEYVIINADSQQLYSELNLLSCMPVIDSFHKLYSKFSPINKINVFEWTQLAIEEIEKAFLVKKQPIILGGTGLYFKILKEGIVKLPKIENLNYQDTEIIDLLKKYDPIVLIKYRDINRRRKALFIKLQTGKSIFEFFQHPRTRLLKYDFKIFGLIPDKKILWNNIATRIEWQFYNNAPIFDEVENYKYETSNVIGFNETKAFLNKKINLSELKNQVLYKTRQYAKRQKTYIKNSLNIDTICNNPESLISLIKNFNP